MKIGIFTDAYSPLVSGVVTSVRMLEVGLTNLGHDVYIITNKVKNSPKDESDHIIRFNGLYIPKKALKDFRLFPVTRRRIKKVLDLELDVLHVHTEFSMGRLARAIARETNTPLVYTVHTMYEDYIHHVTAFGARYFHKSFMKAVKRMINGFVSEAAEIILPTLKVEETMRRYNLHGSFNIIPTGINLTKFYKENYAIEDVNALKAKLGINDELVFLFVGRVAHEKSLNVIIDEFSKVAPYKKAKLLIVGDGPAMKDIKKQIEELKLKDKVILTGMVPWSDVGLYYQVGDVFVNASLTETQGLTYIEALAASLPVVVKFYTCLN